MMWHDKRKFVYYVATDEFTLKSNPIVRFPFFSPPFLAFHQFLLSFASLTRNRCHTSARFRRRRHTPPSLALA
jgi:hypothetical protein